MPEFDDPRLLRPSGDPVAMQVAAGVSAIRCEPAPDAEMVTQALHGEVVDVFEECGEFGRVQLRRDRYVGWALMEALSAPLLASTHRISALRTYVHSEPTLKSAPRFLVTLGAEMVAEGEDGDWVRCARAGWVHKTHLEDLTSMSDDPAAVAERYLGTPYLWGGRESLGLDCTGLTVAAYGACGVLLPRDSDMQFAWTGTSIEQWTTPGTLRRNDLVFWKGHVGIMLDAERIIHANAHHMAVASEPLAGAIDRISAYYAEPIGARRIDLEKARQSAPGWMSR